MDIVDVLGGPHWASVAIALHFVLLVLIAGLLAVVVWKLQDGRGRCR